MVQSGLRIMHRLMPNAGLTLLYHLYAAVFAKLCRFLVFPAQLGLLYQAIKKRDYVAASGSIVTVNQFVQAAGWGSAAI